MTEDFAEFSTEELNIPSLTAKRVKQSDGGVRVMIAVTPVKWDKELKRPRVTSSKNVGVVANNQEFGPIVFKEEFLQQYPQLRTVTVLRKESRQYVYIKTPLETDTIGYHKIGRRRYHPQTVAGTSTLELERYLRPDMLPRYHGQQERLARCQIGLIGVGGMGGLCALLLGTAGVGQLRLADGDEVALHNLHRQLLFANADLGQPKATCAARTIERHVASVVQVKPLVGMIGPDNFAAWSDGLDLVIDASDNAQSRLVVSKLCLEHGLPLLSAAVSGYQALLALFDYANPDFLARYGCYRCLTSGIPIDTKVGITGPIASCASALAAHVVLEWLLGNKDLGGTLLSLNLSDFRLTRLRLSPDPACPDHNLGAGASEHSPGAGSSEYSTGTSASEHSPGTCASERSPGTCS